MESTLAGCMILLLPLLWVVAWLGIGALVAAFSGLAPRGAGTGLFLGIFLGGGFGLPVVAVLCRAGWRAWRQR